MVLEFLFGSPFDPKKDIPPLDGKVIVITGANTGLGKAELQHLAVNGGKAKLYLAARSKAKAEAAIKEIKSSAPGANINFLELDLTSLDSVKTAAETFKRDNDRLDILVTNAGIMAHPPGLTKDGYEIQFGTNHLGHFLFTLLLLPLLLKTASSPESDVRIINLTSGGHQLAPEGGFVPQEVKGPMSNYSTMRRYGQSKLANILFTTELVRRYPSITSVAIHPGGVNTNLADEFRKNHSWLNLVVGWLIPWITTSAEKGSYNQTWASVANVEGKATSLGSKCKTKVKQGAYYSPVAKTGGESKYAKDAELAKKLWEWSEVEMQSKGYLGAESAKL
jgi:retinol dehydrogenase-12